jgi:hypothetical protein
MKRLVYLALLFTILPICASVAQTTATQATPTIIAIFPLKNLYGEVKYDSLSWRYADSLVAYLNSRTGSGTVYQLISMDDIRDQMLAQNIDVRAPSYETDVWKMVKLLGAKKIVWGTYLVKYEKANIELKVIDVKTLMPDRQNIADKIRVAYDDALSTVQAAADKITPGLK